MKRVLLVAVALIAGYKVWIWYRGLQQMARDRPRIERALQKVASARSLLGWRLRSYRGQWLAMCVRQEASGTDASFRTDYRQKMAGFGRAFRELERLGTWELFGAAQPELASRMVALRKWYDAEAASETGYECDSGDFVGKVHRIEEINERVGECLENLPLFRLSGLPPQSAGSVQTCLAGLSAVPLPPHHGRLESDAAPVGSLPSKLVSLGRVPEGDPAASTSAWASRRNVEVAISPDSSHIVYRLKRDDTRQVFVDGVEGPVYRSVSWPPVFSNDSSRVAYLGQRDRRWFAVIDGHQEQAYDLLFNLTFSPNGRHYAYSTWREGFPALVLDGGETKIAGCVRRLLFSPDSSRLVAAGVERANESERFCSGRGWINVGKKTLYYDRVSADSVTFSPDSRRVAYQFGRDGLIFTVVDGRASVGYDGVGRNSLRFSDDSRHFVYGARKKDQWCVVLDGTEGGWFDAVGMPVFSPDSRRVAHVARRGKRWLVVSDGKESPVYDEIWPSLHFSADSRLFGYYAAVAGKTFVVINGQRGPGYDHIAQDGPVFSLDSSRFAYEAEKDHLAHVVIDARPGPPYDEIRGNVVFSPDSKHTAYIARQSRHWFVVIDSEKGNPREEILGVPVFSPDSLHEAHVVREGDSLFVVRDGKKGRSYYGLDEHSVQFSSDSAHLAYVAWDGGKWRIVVDDARTANGFTKLIEDAKLTVAPPNRWYLVGKVGQNPVRFGRIEAKVLPPR